MKWIIVWNMHNKRTRFNAVSSQVMDVTELLQISKQKSKGLVSDYIFFQKKKS